MATRARRGPDEIVRELLNKTVQRGATEGEQAAALAKAEELVARHALERSNFDFPPAPEAAPAVRRTIRAACEELLTAEPALGYDEILRRVRAEFAGCNTSVKCLRFYAAKMRLRDVRLPVRPRASRAETQATA